jgi:hypothetical protein
LLKFERELVFIADFLVYDEANIKAEGVVDFGHWIPVKVNKIRPF